MPSDRGDLLQQVANYYTAKLAEHGETPRGVDWNGEESQVLRFEQLCKIFDHGSDQYSLNDLGCGYGALWDYLVTRYPNFSYCGIDVAPDMVRAANVRHAAFPKARFLTAAAPDAVADYGIASGIFNVRIERSNEEWLDYVKTALVALDRTSRLGFAFNCLTSYSDADKKRDYLYYADPCQLFDWCKRQFSRNVALLHDYGLYEFTILVRKAS